MYHTLDICQDVAEKLQQPDKVCEIVREFVKQGHFLSNDWPELSLAESLPGLIVFYGTLHQLFPNQRWDYVAHDYMKLLVDKINGEGISHYSLFEGLVGACFAMAICSQKGIHYPSLLATSEQFLFLEIENSLFLQIDQLLDSDQHVAPHYYNLTHGLSGLIAYLLVRKDDFTCQHLIKACLSRLVRILRRKRQVNGYSLPGWYIPQEEQFTTEEQTKYVNGSFSLTLPYGILGCLSVLSLAALERMVVPEQYEVIQEISIWLKNKQGNRQPPFGVYWHYALSFEEETSNIHEPLEVARDMWNHGTPAVSRSLYLAGKALRDAALMKFAEESFLTVFSKTWQKWHLMGPTFGTGRAGLLALTAAMAQDTRHPILIQQVDHLISDIKRFYSPSYLFGFQTVGIQAADQYRWVDHPGLLNGSIGIVLSMLYGHFMQDMDWCRIFLIR